MSIQAKLKKYHFNEPDHEDGINNCRRCKTDDARDALEDIRNDPMIQVEPHSRGDGVAHASQGYIISVPSRDKEIQSSKSLRTY